MIVDHNDEEPVASKIEFKEEPKKDVLPSREQKNKAELEILDKEDEEKETTTIELKKDKVDDDFFDLIDSMYKERNDE